MLAIRNQHVPPHPVGTPSLPADGVPAAVGERADDPRPSSTPTSSDPVLVVEDDPKFGALVTRAFARSGMRSVHLLSGDGALRAMHSGVRFCAAVLDVMIPHPDGIEVCRHLRRLGSDIPVVAISARSSSDDRARVRAAGADAFLAKPFPLTDLVELTASLVRGECTDDEPASPSNP